jgi:mannose-6-phosphate isomerase-like protein (cupin superfamily)
MKKFSGAKFAETRAWHGPNVANVRGAEVKLRWTDEPYHWHTNTGDEVLVVLDGIVDMHVRVDGREEIVTLHAGDVLHVEDGDEHMARPRGAARMLVIEDPASA